ncbi:MAG: PIG-L family deacetylase [Armatimonadetes bacterium]|nr:PIG-L family deacetylase [Armatimonadota bacterium]
MIIPKSDNPNLAQAILEAKRALFIGAHPDDIEFYCGGLVYNLALAGVDVSFLVATRGGKGRNGRAGERLEKLRSIHQMSAACILGRVNVKLCDYPDKLLAQSIVPLADDIQSHIESIDPDFIFCWDPDFIYNPHPDHQAAADACRIAAEGARAQVIYYGTQRPDIHISLNYDAYLAKIKSLRAHRTETPWYYWLIVGRRLRRKLAQDGAAIQCKYAEVFR